MNLYDETVRILDDYGKTMQDIVFIQGNDFRISWDNFVSVAKETNYDDGFGAQEVAMDLVLVGDGFWLEREEYDGSEGWVFKQMPSPVRRVEVVENLSVHEEQIGWETLEDIFNHNSEKENE